MLEVQVDGFDFQTKYNSDILIRENYKIMYMIYIGINLNESSVYEEYPFYDTMEEIKVFKKILKYEVISDTEILLIYKYDNMFYITITLEDLPQTYNLEGNHIYDSEGNLVTIREYDFLEFIKTNKEFNKALNIKISKN